MYLNQTWQPLREYYMVITQTYIILIVTMAIYLNTRFVVCDTNIIDMHKRARETKTLHGNHLGIQNDSY